MTDAVWRETSAARLPAVRLAALAAVRDRADVRVHADGPDAWVRWSPGRLDVVRCLLPVPGVEFFTRRDGLWFRLGCRVPTADAPPDGDGRPLAGVLVPARFEPVPPGTTPGPPVVLRVVRGGAPRPATALTCATNDLRRWADAATTAELAAVRAARSAGRTVLLGARLPVVPAATRFWGDDLLVPVGYRPDPDLPSAVLRAAVGAGGGELVLLDEGGADVIPREAFEPLTRAGLRLALRDPDRRPTP
jgi:hypothetical protein